MLTTDFSLNVEAEAVLLAQGADPVRIRERRPALYTMAEEAARLGADLVRPSALIQRFRIKEVRHDRLLLDNGHALSGPLVVQHLLGATELVAAIGTIGPQLEKRVDEILPESPAMALALDGFGSSAADALGQEICDRVRRQASEAGLQTSVSLSPGLIGWLVDIGQPQLFGLLQPDPAWVRLTSSCMMQPRKSISMVIGIGQQMDDSLTPCDFCSGKATCVYRHYAHPEVSSDGSR